MKTRTLLRLVGSRVEDPLARRRPCSGGRPTGHGAIVVEEAVLPREDSGAELPPRAVVGCRSAMDVVRLVARHQKERQLLRLRLSPPLLLLLLLLLLRRHCGSRSAPALPFFPAAAAEPEPDEPAPPRARRLRLQR